MVLGLMHNTYVIDSENEGNKERYPEAFRLAKNQHNLNIWTLDKAIIGTNLGSWRMNQDSEEDDNDILDFIHKDKKTEGLNNLNFGDFRDFTYFLKRIIGSGV